MSTGSRGQQQLTAFAQQLPILDQYGYRYEVTLSHPRVTAIHGEAGLDDTAFSSGQRDDTTTFTPLLQIWAYQRCDQPSLGPSHLNIIIVAIVIA